MLDCNLPFFFSFHAHSIPFRKQPLKTWEAQKSKLLATSCYLLSMTAWIGQRVVLYKKTSSSLLLKSLPNYFLFHFIFNFLHIFLFPFGGVSRWHIQFIQDKPYPTNSPVSSINNFQSLSEKIYIQFFRTWRQQPSCVSPRCYNIKFRYPSYSVIAILNPTHLPSSQLLPHPIQLWHLSHPRKILLRRVQLIIWLAV